MGHKRVVANETDTSAVQWNQIVGVITAPGVNNPVGGINTGAGPWSAHEGRARVNLTASGTPAPVTTVTGTLVCNPGTDAQVVRDSAEVRPSQQGDAHFRGEISGIPGVCAHPAFLVRIGPSFPVAAAVGRWLATGAVRTEVDAD